jgi:dTDP-4-dehydrorhamnose 3,5-epimerase
MEVLKESTIDLRFQQVNLSYSDPGVVRGLHFQTKNPQGKLIGVIAGHVIDVVVDLRIGSPTYGILESFELREMNQMVFVPEGFAHGFWAVDKSYFYYQCTTEYNAGSDGGINPMDNDLDLPWSAHIGKGDLLVTPKDIALPYLKDFVSPFIYNGS